MNIAIIPARGGSKRIPRKNIKHFHGKPIIAYSIETALKSQCFDKVIVSTDDREIVEIANHYGAETPFMRPSNLADDHTGTTDVIAHSVAWFNANGVNVEDLCCIYPTAPFISPSDICDSFAQYKQSSSDYLMPVVTFPFPIQRALKINSNNEALMFDQSNFHTRSQDLDEAWHDAGQFYWGKAEAWKTKTLFFTNNTTAYTIDRFRAQDIDTLEDWKQAEVLYSVLKGL